MRSPSRRASGNAVHPRVCGERVRIPRPPACKYGSSPRVRGTCDCGRPRENNSRFIPACAGNVDFNRAPKGIFAVHPRVCGERVGGFVQVTYTAGSSPRVRGTCLAGDLASSYSRFIPACAGNVARECGKYLTYSVHPRVCGERNPSSNYVEPKTGSSPRVRGTWNCGLELLAR